MAEETDPREAGQLADEERGYLERVEQSEAAKAAAALVPPRQAQHAGHIMTTYRELGVKADPDGEYNERLARVEGLHRLGISFERDVVAVLRTLRWASPGPAGLIGNIFVYAWWPAGTERALLAQTIMDAGTPRIVPVRTVADLEALLTQIAIESHLPGFPDDDDDLPPMAHFIRIRTDDIGSVTGARYALPDARVLRTVLRMGVWPDIPVLRGIAPLPLFREDGTICTQEGYDEASGWYCVAATQLAKANPVEVIEGFARRKGVWTGSLTEILAEVREALETAAGREVSPRWLASALQKMAPRLAASGIAVARTQERTGDTERAAWRIDAREALDAQKLSIEALTSEDVAEHQSALFDRRSGSSESEPQAGQPGGGEASV